jgi:uncharacterized protein (TIGR00369 family)
VSETAERIESRADAERLLASAPFHAAIGLELLEWGEGTVALRFAPPALVRAPETGGVHGGAIATALDTAACFAVIAATGFDCATVDLRTDFLRPALDAEFRVEGNVLRAGRRFAWADATASVLDGRVVATARGTFAW